MYLQSQLHTLPRIADIPIMLLVQQYLASLEKTGVIVLRWGIIKANTDVVELEVGGLYEGEAKATPWMSHDGGDVSPQTVVACVIPTGVGASIGGFSGDAGPIARALEGVADQVIVHPNVVNAADFYGGGPHTSYVDGYTLDQFFAGRIGLGKKRFRNIGLLVDRLDSSLLTTLLNAANGMHAAMGIRLAGYAVCDEKVEVAITASEYGHFVGIVHNPNTLLRGVETLRRYGADAIAVVTSISGYTVEDLEAHYAGKVANPVGAVEALISRFITWYTGLPSAHAPAFTAGLGAGSTVLDPRAAAEVASGTGLPCILQGLRQAPQGVCHSGLRAEHLTAIIAPAECCGGQPLLGSQDAHIPFITVAANHCLVGLANTECAMEYSTAVATYAEAIAVVACLKTGTDWKSLTRPLLRLDKCTD